MKQNMPLAYKGICFAKKHQPLVPLISNSLCQEKLHTRSLFALLKPSSGNLTSGGTSCILTFIDATALLFSFLKIDT